MNTTQTQWTDGLSALRACSEAVQWASGYDSLDAAWASCERGDWMLWLLGRLSGAAPESDDRKRLVLCACACARTALPFVREGETRPLAVIETAERWARGEATITEVRKARAYAADAAYAADTAAAAYAADAADAAYAAAATAANAADAAYAAAYVTRSKALKTCADIVRQHYPTAPVLGGAR